MSDCAFASNGGDSGGAAASPGFDVLAPAPIVTTDATVETIIVANLNAPGDGVFYRLTVRAQEDNGERAMRANFWVDASRNVAGTNGLTSGNIGPNGYTDVPPSMPWTTIGVPAGWNFNPLDIVGDQVRVQLQGPVGQTIQWRVVIERLLMWGATP